VPGYKLHLAVGSASGLPITYTMAPANEKKHAPKLIKKACRQLMGKSGF
jgi:hypothetical protein